MQCILVDRPILGFDCISKQITHMGISIMLKSQQISDWPECIAFYQNLDITSIEFGILLVKKKEIIYEFAILKKKDYPREIILNIIL